MELASAFRDGGWPMYVVLAVDLCAAGFVPLALVLAVVARFKMNLRGAALGVGVVALLSALVPMCAGVGGYMLGMHKVEAAVAVASEDQRETMRAMGEAEAGTNLSFGFGSGCLCLVPAVLALMLVPPKQIVYDDF